MSTHSTLVEMKAALLQPCVCRLLASDQVEIPKSSQLHSNTWPSSGVDCSASLHQKSDRSSLFGHITW